ncbi:MULTISPECIES: ABC transporter permease subunit [Rhodococcus]|uniref:ABC transporter permease n=1 Tax=Rhodococcus TaxID=1827 RepID=UPI001EF0DE54|nr:MULTISPECIES: ABC transporter permease subunit [Rhodococcus]
MAPLFVLWFGSMSTVMLVISLVVFIVHFSTFAGLQSASRDHLLLARTLGAKRFELFGKFVFPSAVPAIFAGLQLALTYSFLAAVIGEMLSGSTGLGAVIQRAVSSYQTVLSFACLLRLILIATALSTVMLVVERYLLRWQQIEFRGLR